MFRYILPIIIFCLFWIQGNCQYSNLSDNELTQIFQSAIDLKLTTPNLKEVFDVYYANKKCFLLDDSLFYRKIKLTNRLNKEIEFVTALPLFDYKFMAIQDFKTDSLMQVLTFELLYVSVMTNQIKDPVFRSVSINIIAEKKTTSGVLQSIYLKTFPKPL